MKNLLYIFFLISNVMYSQNNFEINLTSPLYVNDSLMLSTPVIKKSFGELYNFTLQPNADIVDFGKNIDADHSMYFLKIHKENLIHGYIEYPQPVAFIYLDKKKQSGYWTKTFFLEKGKYNIHLPDNINNMEVLAETPTNKDYKMLQKSLEEVYIRSNNFNKADSLINFVKKQELLARYIKKNPDSYAALWEIVNDYMLYNYHPDYLKNMNLFSEKFKQNKLFINIKSRLNAEKLTGIGNKIPDINFDKQNKLTSEDFKKYKLTFIDYWSTTCAPCIKGMPEIVKLQNELKDKNVNFITITDERTPERMEQATNILKKNNATWINFFDINKDFQKKVNATSYPLHFIIDENGKIIARISGNLEEAKNKMLEYLQ
ncbi:Thiol-disulfide isomerase or thioredoxin [Chryseobacterium taichungense]|uniref:Thiol-disulfide isomerase or thioredoxin n=1 Tax=Chryseobacterium taichungense TaxID=295069 RepID=A0A1H7ZMK4_9FLAO|nr:TlpA disulfide reductase family protein [Chryseobacterium taichungense]SEM59174.1 Thiol-disulfide isomerase or thioredoxin [Chryseobacterium taichungense]